MKIKVTQMPVSQEAKLTVKTTTGLILILFQYNTVSGLSVYQSTILVFVWSQALRLVRSSKSSRTKGRHPSKMLIYYDEKIFFFYSDIMKHEMPCKLLYLFFFTSSNNVFILLWGSENDFQKNHFGSQRRQCELIAFKPPPSLCKTSPLQPHQWSETQRQGRPWS